MKNILFATTALVATAGIASADVAGGAMSISGFAEIGMSDTSTAGQGWQFHQDVEVTFSMSGETDSGLSFGTSVQLDEVGTTGAGTDTADDDGVAVFVSGGFGTVTMGDTDGAFDWAMIETNVVGGSLADDETGHSGFTGNAGLDGGEDGQVLRWNYSMGAIGIAASLEQDGNNGANTNDDATGFGLSYALDAGGTTISFGVGMQDASATSDITGFSVRAAMDNGLTIAANMSDQTTSATTSVDRVGFGLGYTMDALSVGINWGEATTSTTGAADAVADGVGLAVNYDLGSGAVAQFGYGSGKANAAAASATTMSAGLALSF
jgi:outer membrane protein OmpU